MITVAMLSTQIL